MRSPVPSRSRSSGLLFHCCRRRSDPAKQGGILGVSQGVSALARIIGPLVAVPLFTNVSHTSPYFASIGLMILGLAALLIGARGGRDYGEPEMTKS